MFDRLFVPDVFLNAVSDVAWLAAMLDAERALAAAGARAGVVPAEAARAIAAACRPEGFDPAALAERGRAQGSPVPPLVQDLRDAVGGEAADYVHLGATSQDILDTAEMLVTRQSLDLLVGEVDGLARALASLAEAHRLTPMAGRTLLQHAVPTTFGLKAAGWLVAVVEARRGLDRIRSERLAAELGGAAGTLAALGERGLEILGLYAEELGLPEPELPWHANRLRIGETAAALALAAGSLAKIALDVALLAQTEVGEVAESVDGGSSTMPQKRNPVDSVIAAACARQVEGHAYVLIAALPQEHERAAGAWHAEWPALSGALAYAGGAAAAVRRAVEGLEVDVERMRANLDASKGGLLAERVTFLLAPRIGRRRAHEIVVAAARRAAAAGRTLREELLADPEAGLTLEEADQAFDPSTYLGAAAELVGRALDLYRRSAENSG